MHAAGPGDGQRHKAALHGASACPRTCRPGFLRAPAIVEIRRSTKSSSKEPLRDLYALRTLDRRSDRPGKTACRMAWIVDFHDRRSDAEMFLPPSRTDCRIATSTSAPAAPEIGGAFGRRRKQTAADEKAIRLVAGLQRGPPHDQTIPATATGKASASICVSRKDFAEPPKDNFPLAATAQHPVSAGNECVCAADVCQVPLTEALLT